MDIKVNKESNGSYKAESKIDFGKGGNAEVSVNCDEKGYDEFLLRKETEFYLNNQASKQGMRVVRKQGPTKTVHVNVERGESARVKKLVFPIDILPREDE